VCGGGWCKERRRVFGVASRQWDRELVTLCLPSVSARCACLLVGVSALFVALLIGGFAPLVCVWGVLRRGIGRGGGGAGREPLRGRSAHGGGERGGGQGCRCGLGHRGSLGAARGARCRHRTWLARSCRCPEVDRRALRLARFFTGAALPLCQWLERNTPPRYGPRGLLSQAGETSDAVALKAKNAVDAGLKVRTSPPKK